MENERDLSISNLREILWEEIHSIRRGDTSAANVNAITNATGKILGTIKIELEFAKLTGQQPRIDMLKIEGGQAKKLNEK